MTNYPTGHLDTIIGMAVIVRTFRADVSADAALSDALDSAEITYREATGRVGVFSHTMSAEMTEDWQTFGGVIRDVRNGFTSPTLGNVRDYCLARILAG